MASDVPPPVYDVLDANQPSSNQPPPLTDSGPQILIIPSADTINFQKGFLGADGERAAVEGELQIKGAEPFAWEKLSVSLSSNETAYGRNIELGFSEVVLYSYSRSNPTPLPSSFLFAIPLTPDTPQSIRTSHSSLAHVLTVELKPLDAAGQPITKSLIVHTKRYSSHVHSLNASPELHSLDDPARVEVEIPRSTFKVGEPIPVYITVPPPPRDLIVNEGLRLRNVMAELVRTVQVRREEGDDDDSNPEVDDPPVDTTTTRTTSDNDKDHGEGSSSNPLNLPFFFGSSYRTVIGRSGASCRFHSSRAVQLRLILHQSPSRSPADFQMDLPPTESGLLESDAECPAISQTTVLHSISFRLDINVSFVDMASRTERLSTISIPLTILPPPARLPEVEHSVDEAYQKKHDRPPARTVRADEVDSVPHYDTGAEAGPSGLLSGAPPPFEERDAPPPFFSSAAEASTSNRLPTFQESETEIILPDSDLDHDHLSMAPVIVGEGTEFGFTSDQQFDGHSEGMQRVSTPPPSLAMASRDPDLTEIADIREPEHAMEVLGLVLDQHEEMSGRADRPPPPPAMDDPSDPPPSIDSDFRSPSVARQGSPPHPSSPPTQPGYIAVDIPRLQSPLPPPLHEQSHGHAPPPYLGVPQEQEHVTRPPPYVD
ncbi:hypothetical protein PC9H_003799 [Pleurotus ostreatus]|uniref:Uncharacterized protein n=1 Tax=Pleurotus ostreatus TaxID=5322 RepID=A0A8H7A6H6_PLEOS|nr:uncharacterized protein PC9H_003799 [Pleurotus ostreatus]KAF7436965.1 hypothetical protein PC9H_003799 [Pleurotus ostreatus]KAJ8702788.1 hypothetical protein PTI98_001474 [Pleurotus ostreatus]